MSQLNEITDKVLKYEEILRKLVEETRIKPETNNNNSLVWYDNSVQSYDYEMDSYTEYEIIESSDLGDEYEVIDKEKTVDELSKTEYDKVIDQDNLATYEKTKEYIKTASTAYNIGAAVFGVGRLVIGFL